jgi:phenylpropionate dioxygenase-like ring-hydroxylating dioxygenase large terminal subunit
MNEAMINHLKETVFKSKGLPGSFFTSQEVMNAEKQYFFRESWLCAGLTSDVADAGQVYPVTILDQPLLMVRTREGSLRVFHNVCSHRGAELVQQARKCTTILCPYHAWAYDLNGELKQTPHVGGENIHECAEIDKTRLGLKEVRSDTWAGLVFVNISGDAVSLEEHMRPLTERWQRIDLSLLEHVSDMGQRPKFEANWKLVVENFVESYHLPWVHKSMNAFNPMGAHYQILGADRFIGQGVKAHNPTDAYAGKFRNFPALKENELGTGESMYVPANLILITMSDFMFANIVTPISPGVTTERIEMFLIGDDASNPDLHNERQQLMDMLSQVNNEDIGICELAQKGRNSEAFTGGAFAPIQELTTLQFQQLVARKMLVANGVALDDLPALAVEDIHHPE